VLRRREVTGGRHLSAFHGSLGTDCGEDSQERAVREGERMTQRERGREYDIQREGE